MKRRRLTIALISAGVLALFILVVVLVKSSGTTTAAAFKRSPFEKGYRYTGTGDISLKIDNEKIKRVSGFPDGDAGQNFVDMIKKDISSMDMDIIIQGSGKENEEISSFKMTSKSGSVYESKFYTDGTKKWVFVSDGSNNGKWSEVTGSDAVEGITSSINIENFEKFKGSIVLKSQDNSSSTFSIKVDDNVISPLLGPDGQKAFEKLCQGKDFDQFVDSMNMVMEIKTSKKVDSFSPYDEISNIKLSFVLPFNSLESFTGQSSDQMGQEEEKIFDSIYLNVNIDMDFSYDSVTVEKPI